MSLSNIFCLICDVNIDNSSCINVFSTTLPHHGELLVNFVSKVLCKVVTELRSPYICLQCHNLFQMLEQAQKTVLKIRREISKIYRATERTKIIKQSIYNDAKVNERNTALEEEKLIGVNKNLKGESNLDAFQIEEIVQQQYIKNNVHCNNISTSSSSHTICNEIVIQAKEHQYCTNEYNSNIPQDTEKSESKNYLTTDIFSNNRLQAENGNCNWKEINENILEVKGNSENATVSVKSGKISQLDLKSLKYQCPNCHKKWKTRAELKIHVKTHSTLKPYMCEKCGKAYKHKHALEIHVGMHNGINPFQCNFCQKCFTQKGALMRHLPIHTGEMPYQCELCGKRFIHHTSYNMHRLSHTGKKSYKCHVCDLSLLSTSHLKRHMRVHTGEKPYSCTVCGKRFAERYNLLAHQKSHSSLANKTQKTTRANYQCNHCNTIFQQKENLNEHIKQHTNTIKSDAHDLAQEIDLGHGILQQTWIQINRPKLDIIDSQARLVVLQNSLPEIKENTFALTFNSQKASSDSTNYNTNLQVIIEPSNITHLSNNLSSIAKMHM